MSVLYGPEHRALQDAFDTRRLADHWQVGLIHGELAPPEQAFIEASEMFFLATVDAEGKPTVSYKGGEAGFVRVVDPTTLLFPGYDGNGMFLSAGNIATTHHVGLLFIDFATPNRLRVQGEAEIVRDQATVESFVGASHAVRVRVTDAFANCARYIHRYEKVSTSRHVPRPNAEQPVAAWKRIDDIQPHLPEREKAGVAAEGAPLTLDGYVAKVAKRES